MSNFDEGTDEFHTGLESQGAGDNVECAENHQEIKIFEGKRAYIWYMIMAVLGIAVGAGTDQALTLAVKFLDPGIKIMEHHKPEKKHEKPHVIFYVSDKK